MDWKLEDIMVHDLFFCTATMTSELTDRHSRGKKTIFISYTL